MVNQPDQDMQGVHSPARKLALPEPPNAGQYRRHYSSPRSGQFINQPTSAASHSLFTRVLHRWRTEPAFAVLSVAIVLVIIVSLVFVSLGASAMAGNAGGPVWNQAMTQHPVVPAPTGTVDVKPKFPTPVTGKGSKTSSQPSGVSATTLQPTTTTSNDQGTLSVQIGNLSNVVPNKSQVQVDVQTSEPNVDVRLQVTYDASPFYYTNGGDTTDNNGNATLNWNVHVRALLNNNNTTATVVVVATDQNGQQATSQPVTVLVTN
jgi:hypothetical protein